MASPDDIIEQLTKIAYSRDRTWDERLDALLALARHCDARDYDSPVEAEEAEALIQAIMLDARGHEIVVRSVLNLIHAK